MELDKRARRGVTLIEAVLFISIALGLIVGGLVFFQQASLAARTNDAVRSLSSIASETRAAYRTQDSFAGLNAGVLIASGAVPSSQTVADADSLTAGDQPGIVNEWNQPVLIVPSAGTLPAFPTATGVADRFFEITYSNIPEAACTRLATASDGNGPIGPGIVAVRVVDSATSPVTTPAGSATNFNLTGAVNITPAQAATACGNGTDPVDVIWTLTR
ncbi:MAG: type 4 pilus major pilin [Rhodobacteraceae bacterium]|nr:type 4 pilus major pilin [Paracoccaceae bacterium]MCZ8295557.1 type 4 pilus major pilin [Paracoccaceae bacterium]